MRALVLAMLVPATALAGGNEITVGTTTRTLATSSGTAVSTDPLSGGTIGYAREVAMLSRLALWIEGDFQSAGTSGTMFRSIATDVSEIAFSAGARLRYQPLQHLALLARLDLGAAHTRLQLDAASDAGWSALARAAAAVDLYAVDRPRFALGIRFEGGYVESPGPSLAPAPAMPSGALLLKTTSSSIGRLDLSGPYISVALTSKF
jgi:hypothetical protein